MPIALLSLALAGPIVQVEVDPLPFALDGAAGHVRVALPGAERWTVGAGLYAQDMPALLLTLAPQNRGDDWTGRLFGAGLFVDHYFKEPVNGAHLGTQVAAHRWTVGTEDGDTSFTSLLVMPRVGYVWQPFDGAGLYVDPWIGAGPTLPISGSRSVAGDEFGLFPAMFFGAMHVGWRFGPKRS